MTAVKCAGDLYGTDRNVAPVSASSSAPARCVAEPTPVCENEIWPGDFFASAINSFTFFAGTDGCTTSIYGCVPTSDTGAKSFAGSYGSFLNRLGLIATPPVVPRYIV